MIIGLLSAIRQSRHLAALLAVVGLLWYFHHFVFFLSLSLSLCLSCIHLMTFQRSSFTKEVRQGPIELMFPGKLALQGVPFARGPEFGCLWFWCSTILPSCFCKIPISPGRIGQTMERSKLKSTQPSPEAGFLKTQRSNKLVYLDQTSRSKKPNPHVFQLTRLPTQF